jgi:hypothetical protein
MESPQEVTPLSPNEVYPIKSSLRTHKATSTMVAVINKKTVHSLGQDVVREGRKMNV